MTRSALPFHTPDISALARSLHGQLAGNPAPGHVEMLNMLARAGGYRNFQHFRAQSAARDRLDAPAVPPHPPEPVDYVKVRRLLRFFDDAGRLIRWPPKRSYQELCLWVLWSKLPARRVFNELEVNGLLKPLHLFGDHALLRRWLCDYGMMTRTVDGGEYRRVEQKPPADAAALIRQLGRGAADGASGQEPGVGRKPRLRA